jgi:alpha-glucosidase (family GH31 glycosyl hydrolase)
LILILGFRQLWKFYDTSWHAKLGICCRKTHTAGIFWLNAAETWVDILGTADQNVVSSIVNFVSGSATPPQVDSHFMSESGIIDTFFMLGPKPKDVFRQYTRLTGTTPLPQASIIFVSLIWQLCLVKE